jgi:hypothetical protein
MARTLEEADATPQVGADASPARTSPDAAAVSSSDARATVHPIPWASADAVARAVRIAGGRIP